MTKDQHKACLAAMKRMEAETGCLLAPAERIVFELGYKAGLGTKSSLLAACKAALARLKDPYLGEDNERQKPEIEMLEREIARAEGRTE